LRDLEVKKLCDPDYFENEIQKNLIIFLKSMIYDEKKRQKAVKSKAYSDKNSHQESAFDNSYNKRMKIKQEVYSTNSDNNMFTVPMPNKHTNNMGFKPIHQQNQ